MYPLVFHTKVADPRHPCASLPSFPVMLKSSVQSRVLLISIACAFPLMWLSSPVLAPLEYLPCLLFFHACCKLPVSWPHLVKFLDTKPLANFSNCQCLGLNRTFIPTALITADSPCLWFSCSQMVGVRWKQLDHFYENGVSRDAL